MAYVVVRNVFDPEEAAKALDGSGERERALLMRRSGKDCAVVPREMAYLPSDPSREQIDALLGKLNGEGRMPGTWYHVRTDYDPDWALQFSALESALEEVWRVRGRGRMAAVPAVNAYRRNYFGWGSEWDLPDPTERSWSAAERRNFSDAARLLANAVAGQRLVKGSAPAEHVLMSAVAEGWRDAERDKPEIGGSRFTEGSALEVAYGLAYVMRKFGEAHLDWLEEAIRAGAQGNS